MLKILKPESTAEVSLQNCGPRCLRLNSQTDINFEIKIDNQVNQTGFEKGGALEVFSSYNQDVKHAMLNKISISAPEFHVMGKTKTLHIPSLDFFKESSLGDNLRYWLVGHEIHPYVSQGKLLIKPVQQTAFFAYQQAIQDGAKSFLHISPTAVGKTLVLSQALVDSIARAPEGKNIVIATVNRVHIVDQLSQAIQKEISHTKERGKDIQVINWNHEKTMDFEKAFSLASNRDGSTVFVITTQALKRILTHLGVKLNKKLKSHLNAIFIDEAHHLGAYLTKEVLLHLQKTSGIFLYGATATPLHHEVNLRDLFDKVHWSYLNTQKNLFEDHPSEGILRQLSQGIERGDLTPFDDLYFIADSLFKPRALGKIRHEGDKVSTLSIQDKGQESKQNGLFVTENNRRVLNPDYYQKLAEILYPILVTHEKGFLVTATVREAERLTEFLTKPFPKWQFESYHYGKSRQEKSEILSRSRERGRPHYIVAVRALDEGVDLPHLSTYIDLNANIPIKQMLQRIGRVLRLQAGKLSSDIVLLIDYRDEQIARDLLNVLDLIKKVHFNKTVRDKEESAEEEGFVLAQPKERVFYREDLASFREVLEETVRQFWLNSNVTSANRPALKEFIRFVIEQKDIRTQPEYQRARKEDASLKRFPSWPEQVYPDFKWPGRRKWVTSANRPTLKEFISFVIEQKDIRTQAEYQKQRKTDDSLKRFPSWPEQVYPNFKWPGRDVVTSANRPTLEEFIRTVKQKNIRTRTEYERQRKIDTSLKRFPSYPEKSYPDFKWPGRKVRVTSTNRPTLEEFIRTVEQKDIKTQKEYNKQRKTDASLKRFPSMPEQVYPDFKWPGRGRIRLAKHEIPPVEEFTRFVIEQKNIRTQKEYNKARKIDTSLKRFPSYPEKSYPDFKWLGRNR